MQKLFKFTILLFILCACATSNKSSDKNIGIDLKPDDNKKAPKVTAVTSDGINTYPNISLDGKKLLYVAAEQEKHNHPQAYEKDLATGQIQRLTFQNGVVHEVVSTAGRQIAYSSSTDEIKEDPDFIRKALAPPDAPPQPEGGAINPVGEILPRSEIYIADRNSNSIRRLTERKGFDGFLAPHPKRNELVFSYWTGMFFELASLDLHTGQKIQITKDRYDIDPVYSFNGEKLAWVRWDPPSNKAEILVGSLYAKQFQRLIGGDAIYRSPTWSADGAWIAFSANINDFTNFEIYRVRTDGTCLQRLTYQSGQDSHPRFEQNQRIFFQSDRSGRPQIYELDLNTAAPCPNPTPALQ